MLFDNEINYIKNISWILNNILFITFFFMNKTGEILYSIIIKNLRHN